MTSKNSASRPVGRPAKPAVEKAQQSSVYLTRESVLIVEQMPGRTWSEKVNNALSYAGQVFESRSDATENRASA